jgi:isopentenyldiphosphate isomerase
MSAELLDYFDENYVRQGTTTKDEARAKGLWVHSFHCWMLNRSDTPKILVQKRAKSKALFPDFLDISAAGHLSAGETVEDGVREIKEEVGLDVNTRDLVYLGIKLDVAKTNGIVNRQFCHVFLYPESPSIDQLTLDKVELDGMVEIPVEAGLQLFRGDINSLIVQGVEKSSHGTWERIQKEIKTSDFIPRVDAYYFKMFIIADLYIRGYPHLCV